MIFRLLDLLLSVINLFLLLTCFCYPLCARKYVGKPTKVKKKVKTKVQCRTVPNDFICPKLLLGLGNISILTRISLLEQSCNRLCGCILVAMIQNTGTNVCQCSGAINWLKTLQKKLTTWRQRDAQQQGVFELATFLDYQKRKVEVKDGVFTQLF